ncbi:methyltransferase family protein [Tenacibaculum adriaticum]|uniref:Methyltransferase family protein n=2 Tax=Tenacibaculum adriaticum TaxID=413713 RepID=A0A5S5DTE4_9FLAO|nr:methyltransferase family protein [Tenacibaculum adriaticum]
MNKENITYQTWNKVAQKYEDKFMSSSVYTYSFDALLQHTKIQNAKILDVGCGPGNITKYPLERNPNFNITGIDFSENMIELAKKNNPETDFKVLDCRNIDNLKQKYDVIIYGFCFPYISKEETIKLIKKSKTLLNENGLIFISTMIDDYDKSEYKTSSSGDKIYTYYHQENDLVEELKINNFKLLENYKKEYTKNNVVIATDLFLIAKR